MIPQNLKAAKILVESLEDELFAESEIAGYRIASCCSDYGEVAQRWLIIESEQRRDSDLRQLES